MVLGLALCHELKNQRGIAWCLEALAGVVGAQGRAEQVAQLLGAVTGLLESISLGPSMMPRAYHERDVAAARAALGEEAFAAASAAGRAMPLEAAIQLALEEVPED